MGLVVGFGSKNLTNYDPTASTVGLDPSNKFSYGTSSIGTVSPLDDNIGLSAIRTLAMRVANVSKNERWRIA